MTTSTRAMTVRYLASHARSLDDLALLPDARQAYLDLIEELNRPGAVQWRASLPLARPCVASENPVQRLASVSRQPTFECIPRWSSRNLVQTA